MFLAASTGTPAFGLERFGAGEPKGKFVYFTEEDSERVVAQRLRWLLAGRTLSHPPENLYLKGRAGLNFLNPKDQKGILEALGRAGAVGAAFDPARAYMPGIDGGPADGAAAVEFVRRIQNETKCKTILIPHHDVKPPRDGKDIRSRSDRASGGVLYSAAECPVNFERVDDRTCFAVPANYKIGSDPKPFRVRFESATGAGEPFRHFLRPVAETVSEQQDKEQRRNAGLETRVVPEVLRIVEASEKALSGSAVHEERGGSKPHTLEALKLLAATKRVDTVPGRKKGDVAYRGLR